MFARLSLRRLFILALILCTLLLFMTFNFHDQSYIYNQRLSYNLTTANFTLRHSGDITNNINTQEAEIVGQVRGEQNDGLTNLDININIDITKEQLLNVLQDIVESERKAEKLRNVANAKEALLTLFTTLSKNESSKEIFNRTLRNWAMLKPMVRPVLFTEGNWDNNFVVKAGWNVLNVSKVAPNGIPILKYMFKDVMKTFRSKYYGFANADIIFTDSLVTTLTAIEYSDLNRSETFISGRRTNVKPVSDSEAATFLNITQTAKARGELFQTSAEDYFITGNGYSWDEGPEVIVGSLGYDNWLVFEARASQRRAIDCTNTLLAVHQSYNNTGYFSSHFKKTADYNKVLIKKFLKGLAPPYPKGFTDCLELYTVVENGIIVIKERKPAGYCKVG